MKGIVLALIRASLANNPTPAVKHQIQRLYDHYAVSDMDMALDIQKLWHPDPNEGTAKIVQSDTAPMSLANKADNPMLELLKQHIENTPAFQLKAEFEQLKNSCADSPNALEYIEALEKYYGNANKAVMWAVKDPGGNYIGFSDDNPLTEAGMWFKGVRYSIEFWNMAYVSRGWTIVPVEVREIVNDKNVSDE